MKGGTRAGLALAAGYVLGRRHKLRTAALLGAAVASGRLGALGASAVKRGTSMGGAGGLFGKATPQLGGIADKVRGELVNAGKAAAMAAVSSRIESFSDSIHQRTEAIRGPKDDQDDADDTDPDDADDTDPDDREPEDDYPDDASDEYADDAYEDEDEADDDEYEDEDEADDLDEPESSPGRRPGRMSRSPVSRTGR